MSQRGVSSLTYSNPERWSSISFIIPLFNNLKQTQAMLKSLLVSLPLGLDFEIILIDDGSSDGTREWLRSLDKSEFCIHLNSKNLGYAAANNVGVKLAHGDVLGLLNNDLLFEPGWLVPMLDVLLSSSLNAGLVGNLQYRVDDGALEHAGIYLNAVAKFEHIKKLSENQTLYTKVLAVSGACVLLRKSDFEDLGGFNERYINGCEDVDLCFRLSSIGKAVYIANNSQVQHHVGLSRGDNTLRNEKNSRFLFECWRHFIRQDLSGLWELSLLESKSSVYINMLDGELVPDFMADQRRAACIIAEAIILREEYRWIRELDKVEPNKVVIESCISKGGKYVSDMNGYVMCGYSSFEFRGLNSARNFYVCGYSQHDFASQPVMITIEVNGIQKKSFQLLQGNNFNCGIIDPLLIPDQVNYFKVCACLVEKDNSFIDEGGATLIITHLVIDDYVLDRF